VDKLPFIRKEDSWHLFETHVTTLKNRKGKHYKDWLFARLQHSDDPAIDVIQGGATLIIRDVVRNYIRDELLAEQTVSIFAPLSNNSNMTLTLEDILPGNSNTTSPIILKEYEEIAEKRAKILFRRMSKRERIAFSAKAMGIAFSHKRVLQAAGCEKSTMLTAYKEFIFRTGLELKQEYENDDRESVLKLTMMIIECIKKRAYSWVMSEKRRSILSKTAGVK
jgi:hypothetical protein